MLETAAQPLTARRILVVEDNPINMRVTQLLLSECRNVVPVFATSGRMAIKHFDNSHFDMILLDIGLPDMDGGEVCQYVRKQPRGRSLPVIAYTAFDGAIVQSLCLQAGMDDFLIKPVKLPQLKAMIQRYLGKSHTRMRQ